MVRRISGRRRLLRSLAISSSTTRSSRAAASTRGRRAAVGEQLDLDVIAAALARVAGDDPGADLGLDDGGHLAIRHGPGVGHPGDDADVAGGLVVQHHTAVAGLGGLHRGASGIGRQGRR